MNTGTPTGNPEEQLFGFSPQLRSDGVTVTVPVEPCPGCGNQYWLIGADNKPRKIAYIPEGTKRIFSVLIDPLKTAHLIFALPLGGWSDIGGFDPLTDAYTFQLERSTHLLVDFSAGDATEIVETIGDSGQLTGWTINGMIRWSGCFSHNGKTTEGELNVLIESAGSTKTVSLYLSGHLVAQGSRTGSGSVTLSEQNSSGISGSVTLTYTADVTADCVVVKRWPAYYVISCVSAQQVLNEAGDPVYNENGDPVYTSD